MTSIHLRQICKRLAAVVVIVGATYTFGALCVFDFTEPAYPFDEETYEGRDVAFGPRPRFFFCSASYHGFFYTGEEWAFFAYKPLCVKWAKANNYALPRAWRENTTGK